MIFLANENIPKAAIDLLRKNHINITSIAEVYPGISDNKVIELATIENRTILTHDKDYGELIFKYGLRPPEGIILFKLTTFQPEDPARSLLSLISDDIDFANRLTVVNEKSIRQRKYR